jgi:hypothetical protein
MNATPLNPSEQAFYDIVANLDDKDAHVREELFHQVETGNITKFEQSLLLAQNAEKIATLTKENKPTDKALQRKVMLEGIEPMEPHALKYEPEIYKLRKELVPLLALEKEARGRLLTLKETTTLGRKIEIDDEIAHLEDASRGWFEEDAVFESRLKASRTKFETKLKKKAMAKMISIGADTKMKMNTKWLTPQEQKAWAKKEAAKKKKNKQKGASAFSSMIMDSSSDEDDSDDDDDQDDDQDDGENQVDDDDDGADDDNVGGSATGTKRKRKKKKKSRQLETEDTTDEAPNSISGNAISILHTFILPLLLAFVGWLVSMVFGKAKAKKKRN